MAPLRGTVGGTVGGSRVARAAPGALRCRRKFLHLFPRGFRDPRYLDFERDYKWETHLRWLELLGEPELRRLLRTGRHAEIAARAIRIEQRSRHPMIFSFEKMALRDALRSEQGARRFAEGLHALLHGKGTLQRRFEDWVEVVRSLPRRQTRVLTWPLVTVFGAIARPDEQIFVKPLTMRAAARAYGFDLAYAPTPSWTTYRSVLDLAALVRHDLRDLRPRDMIDVQSFLWVQGSAEYA